MPIASKIVLPALSAVLLLAVAQSAQAGSSSSSAGKPSVSSGVSKSQMVQVKPDPGIVTPNGTAAQRDAIRRQQRAAEQKRSACASKSKANPGSADFSFQGFDKTDLPC